jgi:CRISPR-associated endonuclease Csn1
MNTTLALDIGTSSIGFALIDFDAFRILWIGVYIFPEGIKRDKGKESKDSKNAERRTYRQARKLIWRRQARKELLLKLLQTLNYCPTDEKELLAWQVLDPYKLRKDGLDKALTPHEFGRALYHLNQRRGFKSNRKSDGGENEKKTGMVDAAIGELGQAIHTGNFRTLGEYLYSLNPHDIRRRSRYTSRDLYKEEFDSLWKKQQPTFQADLEEIMQKFVFPKFHKKVREGGWRHLLENYVIFYQRKLKSQKKLIGTCTLEPTSKRSPLSAPIAQEFRLLDKLHSIRLTGGDRKWSALTRSELQTAFHAFNIKEKWTIKQLLTLLKLKDYRSNYTDKDEFKGNRTAHALISVFGEDVWKGFEDAKKYHIWQIFHNATDNDKLMTYGKTKWELTDEQAEKMKKVSLEKDYAHLSQKAMYKLVPEMKQGLDYAQACVKVGYHHSKSEETENKPLLESPQNVRNPIVQQALYEIRKVVNAVIEKFGKPNIIRVELARELKMPKKQRLNIKDRNDDRQKAHAWIKAELMREIPAKFDHKEENISRDAIIKYKLWRECKKECPYTGKSIAIAQLFNGEFEVEHILPYSRTLNNSIQNKTICERAFNLKKLNNTPFELLQKGVISKQMYEDILKRANHFNQKKYDRFIQEELDDHFITRQLNDTAYIAKEAHKWLCTILDSSQIQISNGQATAALRHYWGLNSILSSNKKDLETTPENNESPKLHLKNRDDHRHHAVDAVVVACTTPAMLRQLSTYKVTGKDWKDNDFTPPWDTFRRDVRDAVKEILIAYRIRKRVRGGLHDESVYGAILDKDKNQQTDAKGFPIYAIRKLLSSFKTKAQINKIADPVIRKLVIERIQEMGGDINDEKFKLPVGCWAEPLYMPCKTGKKIQIKKVRTHDVSKTYVVVRQFKDVQPENTRPHKHAYVEPGSNHHIVIYETTNKKGNIIRSGEVVSLFDAVKRKKQGLAVINQDIGADKRFIMSLSQNEMVLIDNLNPPDGFPFKTAELTWNAEMHRFTDEYGTVLHHADLSPYLYRVQYIDSAQMTICFRHHLTAVLKDDEGKEVGRVFANPNTFKGIKVRISVLGEIEPT